MTDNTDERVEYYERSLFGNLRWFIATSKDYMSYHERPISGKLRFWWQFPRALFRYCRLQIKGFDSCRAIWMLMNWTGQ